MDYISGNDRNQMQFFALEEMVAQDSWARVIDLFVDMLPLKELGFKHTDLRKEGRPPYDPSLFLKLYLYGYKHSIRSSRKLEHTSKGNIELWWLLKGLKPSFRSIAYFRKDNAAALKAAFRYFVIMLQDLELIEGETIAIDSFKIRAQNNFRKNYNQKKIDRHLDYIDTKIEQYEQQLEEADAVEKEQLKVKITTQNERRKKYAKIERQLIENEDTQISITDPDAKLMHVNNNGAEVGYCIQAATDQKHKFFVHADIGAATDKRELSAMALEVKNLLDLKQFNTLSDAGYTTGDQLEICKCAEIITYSAPMPSTSPGSDCIPTAEFIYNKGEDNYTCPAGEVMKKIGNGVSRGHYTAFIYKTTACRTCTIRQECTKNKSGRVIERTQYQDVIDENKARVIANPDYYKLRQQIIEHQFGILKRQWGFTFTLLKRKVNVMSEVNLMMMVYNLTRMISIIGIDVFKKKLGRILTGSFFGHIKLYKALRKDMKALSQFEIPRKKFHRQKINYFNAANPF
jgi:transposase